MQRHQGPFQGTSVVRAKYRHAQLERTVGGRLTSDSSTVKDLNRTKHATKRPIPTSVDTNVLVGLSTNRTQRSTILPLG